MRTSYSGYEISRKRYSTFTFLLGQGMKEGEGGVVGGGERDPMWLIVERREEGEGSREPGGKGQWL